jgi:hypothetical protein
MWFALFVAASSFDRRVGFMKRLVFLASLLLAFSLTAYAQTGIYADYSASNYRLPYIGWHYGPTVGVYYNAWGVPFVRAGIDARASFIGRGSQVEDTGLIGPRVQLHPHLLPLMPYGEALAGASHVDVGQGSAHTLQTFFAYAVVAGADLTIFPRLDWRVAEYTWGGIHEKNFTPHPNTLSTGLVLRLP